MKINSSLRTFIDLSRLNSKYLRFVSLQGASSDVGRDVSLRNNSFFASFKGAETMFTLSAA
jgi:hypothetical protein